MLKSIIFQLKSLCISCELNIPGVTAFYAFLRQFKNHYPVDRAVHLSYERPLMFVFSFFQSRETALHIAVKSKNIEMVKLLLDHGASCENIDRVRLPLCNTAICVQ